MGVLDHLICLLRNLYAGQEATVGTRQRTTDWFKIGKGVLQGCILSLCLFNLYSEHIMWNTGLAESQAGIKIAGRNINNLRYANDNTLMARKWRETKELLDKDERGEWKAGLKLNIQKTKIVQLVATVQFSSVQFSRSVMSNSLRPHESQHTRLPCPSPTARVHPNSRPSSQWCHPAISSSVVPLSSCPQSLPASEFFQWVNSSHEVAKVLEFQL